MKYVLLILMLLTGLVGSAQSRKLSVIKEYTGPVDTGVYVYMIRDFTTYKLRASNFAQPAPPPMTNIYNADGVLTGDRWIDGANAHSLSIRALTYFNVQAQTDAWLYVWNETTSTGSAIGGRPGEAVLRAETMDYSQEIRVDMTGALTTIYRDGGTTGFSQYAQTGDRFTWRQLDYYGGLDTLRLQYQLLSQSTPLAVSGDRLIAQDAEGNLYAKSPADLGISGEASPDHVNAITLQNIQDWNNKLSTESDPSVGAHVKAITPTDLANWRASYSGLEQLDDTTFYLTRWNGPADTVRVRGSGGGSGSGNLAGAFTHLQSLDDSTAAFVRGDGSADTLRVRGGAGGGSYGGYVTHLQPLNDSTALLVRGDGTADTLRVSGYGSGGNGSAYSLPIATTTTLGGIKPDGVSITVDPVTGVASGLVLPIMQSGDYLKSDGVKLVKHTPRPLEPQFYREGTTVRLRIYNPMDSSLFDGYAFEDKMMTTTDNAFRLTGTTLSANKTWIEHVPGTSYLVDPAMTLNHSITLVGPTTLTMAAGQDGDLIALEVIQDATGGHAITWPANVDWSRTANSAAPALKPTGAQLITFIYKISTAKWYGLY